MKCTIAIAISAFHSDNAVIKLLSSIFENPHSGVATVIVVDSLGTGIIETTANERGWGILYENADYNLGSAGNLSRRIQLAAANGANWCLCLNHDTSWDVGRLTAMLTMATSLPRIGAVYPVLDHSPREPGLEMGRRRFAPTVGKLYYTLPEGPAVHNVLWSSSNWALYATAPLADGVEVMKDLWMGYEDLAYGIALHQASWKQLVCRDAVLKNVFDYGNAQFLGIKAPIPVKPVWYSYYNIRNLIMIRRRYGAAGVPVYEILFKLFQSTLRIFFLEDKKGARLKMLYSGLTAGLYGCGGKGRYP